MREALRQFPGQPIPVEDDETQQLYFLVAASRSEELLDEWLRRELDPAIEAADRGELLPFDPERIRRIGKQLLDAANQPIES